MEVPPFIAIAISPRTGVAFQMLYGLGADGRIYTYDYNLDSELRGWREVPRNLVENKKATAVGG